MTKKLINWELLCQFSKILHVMRITVVLILLSTTLSFANGYAQSTKLSINLKQVTVKEALETIEKQSEFIFFYEDQNVDLERLIDISGNNTNIDELMGNLLQGTNNTYRIRDRQIVIARKKEDAPGKTGGIVKQALHKKKKLPGQLPMTPEPHCPV